MVTGPSQERTAGAVRGFVINGDELSKKGRYGAAEGLYQRALILVERTLGGLYPMMAEVLESYADLLVKTDRRAKAIAMQKRAAAVWTGLCSPLLSNASGRPAVTCVRARKRRF